MDPGSPLLKLPNTCRAFYGGFAGLHPLQRQAIDPVLDGCDLVLQSATGSGKTEAVLAPCMERVIRSGREEAVLYVVPTRALAIDLERRLAPILVQRLGLRLSIRTGDVKRAGGGKPDLVLTTPESLDVLAGSSNTEVQRLLRRVRTVVIDEIHPLLHQYRGKQLSYVLRRLERHAGRRLQKIAVSATIADVEAVISFFGMSPHSARLINPVHRRIVPHLVHLKDEDEEFVALLDDLHDRWDYRKVLIFANSRGQCDRLFALTSRSRCFRDAAGLHYSNLKARERRIVEEGFRRRGRALCIATSTLELGIDVGDVDGVVLFDPPDSATAFLQRIGRSNRRGDRTHFWGICRGERAGEQLLRFLGLLEMARRGAVEMPLPNSFPSVLVQQVLSCLYQRKRISRSAMAGLFPECVQDFGWLLPAMEKRGWLRRDERMAARRCSAGEAGDGRHGGLALFHGGWRYRDALLDRRIWSNFPDTEEDYALEVSGEAVADLPRSVVRQLDPGDRVHLAGRRLRVLQIVDAGERKKVEAEPAEQCDDKKILWLGAGFRVPFEVAQSMKTAANPTGEEEEGSALGLFERTRKLLRGEREKRERTVTLANGIEVRRSSGGFYQYRTFLGSMGNLMLRLAIEENPGELDGLHVTSDEIGVTCSHPVDFQLLSLPRDRNGFRNWVKAHFKWLRILLPLNAFADALPSDLLVEEMTGFLYDDRVAGAFSCYLDRSSEVVSGDIRVLDAVAGLGQPEGSAGVLLQAAACAPLLAIEKKRLNIGGAAAASPFDSCAEHLPRPLSGTAIGEFMRHGQCERWLSFRFLPPGVPPSKGLQDSARRAAREEWERRREEEALALLCGEAGPPAVVEETDGHGGRRSLKDRFRETLDRLASMSSGLESGKTSCLLKAVLRIPSIPLRACIPEISGDSMLHRTGGIGFPDFIRVSAPAGRPLLEAGGVADSAGSLFSRKWRVAFHALLLGECLRTGMLPPGIEISGTGVLITRGGAGVSGSIAHSFDLAPFLAAFPALLQHVDEVLRNPPAKAAYRLDRYCTSCACYEHCTRQALSEEDLQFLPAVRGGMLWKLRQAGLSGIESAGGALSALPGCGDPLNASQRDRLSGSIEAFLANAVRLRKPKTKLFPRNLSIAIFLHLSTGPASSVPRTFGWLAVDEAGNRISADFRAIAEEADFPSIYAAFWEGLSAFRLESFRHGQRPHLFHFGNKVQWGFRECSNVAGDANGLFPFLDLSHPRSTDLARLLEEHFDFPIPGRLTLYAAGRVLGFVPGAEAAAAGDAVVPAPESFFHDDCDPFTSQDAWSLDAALREDGIRHMEAVLGIEARIWKWVHGHLESDFEETDWGDRPEGPDSPAENYLHFLEKEKRLREEDVLSLQCLCLEERVERFRALGPLVFAGTSLDDEGRFLYDFKIERGDDACKFREDDFLKLAPVGAADLQSGFPVILARFRPGEGVLSVLSRRGALALTGRLTYSLEEDLTDWNHPRLVQVVSAVLGGVRRHPVADLLAGGRATNFDLKRLAGIRVLLEGIDGVSALNPAQRNALELPFRKSPALIEGPPGTGKTHLLGWIIVALLLEAHHSGSPLRIAVSALTHRAIDGVLRKAAELANAVLPVDFPLSLVKLGRWAKELSPVAGEDEAPGPVPFRVQPLLDPEEIWAPRNLVLGGTGFGLNRLFGGRAPDFPQVFDWIVFDEASQVLVPEALLSLVFGRGNCVFLGDVNQLPPVVLGRYAKSPGLEAGGRGCSDEKAKGVRPDSVSATADPAKSILAHLLDCYGEDCRVGLDESYRMNEDLCLFPSRMWYGGALRPAAGPGAHARLEPPPGGPATAVGASDREDPGDASLMDGILDPGKSAVLVLADHRGCRQRSDIEAGIVARLAFRLMTRYGLSPARLALISPHRAQNNAVANRLREIVGSDGSGPVLPTIDTVERVQGSERDAILFSMTGSDPDSMMSDFLNNPNRFNVAITRAKRKLVVVGSLAFFLAVPGNADALTANRCFKEFLEFCRSRKSLFIWKE